jgi:hypothetical protein
MRKVCNKQLEIWGWQSQKSWQFAVGQAANLMYLLVENYS